MLDQLVCNVGGFFEGWDGRLPGGRVAEASGGDEGGFGELIGFGWTSRFGVEEEGSVCS